MPTHRKPTISFLFCLRWSSVPL